MKQTNDKEMLQGKSIVATAAGQYRVVVDVDDGIQVASNDTSDFDLKERGCLIRNKSIELSVSNHQALEVKIRAGTRSLRYDQFRFRNCVA